MTNGNINLMNALASNLSVTEIFRQELERTINILLETELTEFLQYEKYSTDGYNSGNSRNGYYERTIKTQFGEITARIPRDRIGEFSNKTLPPYRREYGDLESMVIHLYCKGITTREIADLIEKMYGCHYSHQTISNMTQVLQEEVELFHSRPLQKRYIAVFCDATYISVKRGTVQKEALHLLLGITESGTKEVLDYLLLPSETKEAYKTMLLQLKERGVESISLFVTDGLVGLKGACLEVFPKSQYQRCWVHLARNVFTLIRKQDTAAALAELKLIYRAKNAEDAQQQLVNFLEHWAKKYPKVASLLSDVTDLFTFYMYPEVIRPSIYSTNLIEGLNKQFKRKVKVKEQFPNEDSLERFACTFFSDYNTRFFERIHRGFKEVQPEIESLFK